MKRYITQVTVSRFVALFMLCAVLANSTQAEWLQQQRPLMGTEVTVELWNSKGIDGEPLSEDVFAEIQRLDLMMNPWNPDSELARINREAADGPTRTTPEIVEVVARALHYSRLSDGAFDISFASAGQHYDYRKGKTPTPQQLQDDTSNIDYQAISLNTDSGEIHFLKPGLQIDLGGIAKGYAVDRGIALLEAAGVQSAVVSAGGDSRILGGTDIDASERPRTVGIRHPRKDDEFVVLIPLADTAISTSGDYERFFIADGVRHHHILDPGTGESARKVQSASVLTEQSMDSDALSTTVFVLGVEKGLALINTLPGVDAIIIDGAGKLHYSEDLLRSVPAE